MEGHCAPEQLEATAELPLDFASNVPQKMGRFADKIDQLPCFLKHELLTHTITNQYD